MYQRYGKRVFDFLIALILLVLLTPLMSLIALLILIFLGAPVVFCQARPGFRAEIFKLNKFRTMHSAAVGTNPLHTDKQRLTQVGTLLRSTHLDEFPQLINVLRGEMSLVGPRPLLVEYLARYTLEQARRHEVLPGMTGLTQISGGNRLSWEKRFELDVWYVDHVSLRLDMYILLITAMHFFTPRKHFTEVLLSEEFEGSVSR